MTATALWPFLPRADSAHNAYAGSPAQSGGPRSDQRGAFCGLPKGPGLSAIGMAAACLCLADVDWPPPASQPVSVKSGTVGNGAPGDTWSE